MIKRFLSLIMAVSLVSTSVMTAFAADITTLPDTTPVVTEDAISNLQVSASSFDAEDGEVLSISYTQDIDAYVYARVFEVSDTASPAVATLLPYSSQSAGSKTLTWYGTQGNEANAAALSDGTYRILISAYENVSLHYNTLAAEVEITSDSSTSDSVNITNLSATDFEIAEDNSEFEFTTDQAAKLTVEVVGQTTIGSYDGSVTSPAGTFNISWNGKDEDDYYVSEGTYTLRVSAENDNGTVVETTTFYASEDDVTDSDIIKDFSLNPSRSWDPIEDDELEIEFELIEDVDDLEIYAVKGSEEIEIYDDRNADEDDYEESWDGLDDDNDWIEHGLWTIVIEADGDRVSKTIEVEYEEPTIEEAFVTKKSFDNTIGEFTTLVFKLENDAIVTVEVRNNGKRVIELLDEESLSDDTWHTVTWDGLDDDGDEEDEDDYEFYILSESEADDDIRDTEEVSFEIDEDDESSNRSNITNDYVEPVVFDDREDDYVVINYCIDETADVTLEIFDGLSASGNEEVTLLDEVSQTSGCYEVKWYADDENEKSLSDDVYSYKILTETDNNRKADEEGRFVIGNVDVEGDTPTTPSNPNPNPSQSECGGYYWDVNAVNGDMCEAITWATENGIFEGYNDGSFKPYQAINRAETLKVVFNAFNNYVTMLPANGSSLGFMDVNPTAWYMTYVRTAKFYGMLHGYVNETEARLTNTINRVEFLKFALEASDAFTSYEIPGYEYSVYADVQSSYPNNTWYFDYAGVAGTYGLYDTYYDLSSGLSYLRPSQDVTRGEVALALYRMYLAGLLG